MHAQKCYYTLQGVRKHFTEIDISKIEKFTDIYKILAIIASSRELRGKDLMLAHSFQHSFCPHNQQCNTLNKNKIKHTIEGREPVATATRKASLPSRGVPGREA